MCESFTLSAPQAAFPASHPSPVHVIPFPLSDHDTDYSFTPSLTLHTTPFPSFLPSDNFHTAPLFIFTIPHSASFPSSQPSFPAVLHAAPFPSTPRHNHTLHLLLLHVQSRRHLYLLTSHRFSSFFPSFIPFPLSSFLVLCLSSPSRLTSPSCTLLLSPFPANS